VSAANHPEAPDTRHTPGVPVTYTPQLGDIGLTSITGDVGASIRLGQWLNGDGFSVYEHAFIYVGPCRGGNIVEAEPGGARMADLTEYADRDISWLPAPTTGNPLLGFKVAIQARYLVGTPYSFADYAAIAAHRLRLPGSRALKSYIASTRHMICSQLADEAARRGGWNLFADGRWPGYVTPGDLYELALKNGTIE